MQLDKKAALINFAGEELLFDALNAIYWPTQRLIIVSDLHLEKGSFFANRGNPLPLYDSLDTLKRLEHLINIYQPKRILTLGDNIHDLEAFNRLSEENYVLLQQLIQSVDEWIWLIGNHDKDLLPSPPKNVSFYVHYEVNAVCFTHDFIAGHPFQIVGHYHPKLTLQKIKGKCFLMNDQKIIMPAFGSYTGGYDIKSQSFKKLFPNDIFKTFMINREKIWRV